MITRGLDRKLINVYYMGDITRIIISETIEGRVGIEIDIAQGIDPEGFL